MGFHLKALVVSHRPLIRAAISHVLISRSGCIVEEATALEDAFRIAHRIGPALVALDLDVPSGHPNRAIASRVMVAHQTTGVLAYGGSAYRPRSRSGRWIHVPSEAPVSAIVSAVDKLFPAQRSARSGGSWRLTKRQLEVLALAASGLSNSEIGDVLFVSTGTVKRHLHETFERLGARSRVDAINRAREIGLAI